VVKEKWSPSALLRSGDHRDLASDVDRRVRGTAGGDRLAALPYSVSTATASHPTLNCLLNSVVSDHAFFGSIDLTDFYLGTDNPFPQFLKVYLDAYPDSVVSRLRLLPFVKLDRHGKRFVLFRMDKTLYGLKEAGKLSNLRLVQLLLSYDFVETSTPCLFRHKTRPITFCLVVDDFGVKYQHRADFDFLVSCLSNLYHCKAHPIAHKFLGFTIAHDRTARTLSLSYPGYIDALLTRLRPNGVKGCQTPSIYTPPRYGSSAPQSPTVDSSPPASDSQKKDLQIAIGYLMYYGRCVDCRLLTATCALACELSRATLDTLTRLDRLLGFASAHRNGHRLYHASDMILEIWSDASYLSRPRARSVAGSYHHLTRAPTPGFTHDPLAFINGPISCHSTQIPVVCSAVQESEYAGLFAAAKIGDVERRILHDLGYPQPPTLILCDNECAVGLAQRTMVPKLSKSIDMRFHWIQDRIKQLQFLVQHVAGATNIADFFTKSLPRAKHDQFAPYCAFDPVDVLA
jgi:hypothetical protein